MEKSKVFCPTCQKSQEVFRVLRYSPVSGARADFLCRVCGLILKSSDDIEDLIQSGEESYERTLRHTAVEQKKEAGLRKERKSIQKELLKVNEYFEKALSSDKEMPIMKKMLLERKERLETKLEELNNLLNLFK